MHDPRRAILRAGWCRTVAAGAQTRAAIAAAPAAVNSAMRSARRGVADERLADQDGVGAVRGVVRDVVGSRTPDSATTTAPAGMLPAS